VTADQTAKLHLPAGSTVSDSDAPWSLVITPETAGWGYSALRVLELGAGGEHSFGTGEFECVVLPLSGGCTVDCDGSVFELAGRRSVFSRVTDFAYVPRDSRVTVRSAGGGRFALPSARCRRRLAPRYGAAEDVQVELRGAGNASRQVNNFCTPQAFQADRLIAVEVLTPGGNWSSYPPHKHDEARPGEAVLEEIYYFELSDPKALAYQHVYGTARVLAQVGTGDAVLIPHGWHGPSTVAPGYDLYYLNVMAGPGADRAWLISDDPAHAWVRDTWPAQPPDPRLPLTAALDRSPP
jgi:5-deoxy-glucuronate isomerase